MCVMHRCNELHACVCACMRARICMYACMCVCIKVMHVCMYVCMYVCMWDRHAAVAVAGAHQCEPKDDEWPGG